MIFRALLALMFIVGGLMHFIRPQLYIKMMPAYLPLHKELVYVSGVFEILLGVGLFGPGAVAEYAAWGLILLLIAVFPANLNMAMHPEQWPTMKPVMLWGRLPLQAVMIFWAFQYT